MGKGLLTSLLLIFSVLSWQYKLKAGNNDTTSKQTQVVQHFDKSTLPYFEVSYVSDIAYNISGGYQTGAAYLGMLNFRGTIGTEQAGLWKGGQVFINGVNIHSTQSFSELVGDIQVASNIDGGNHTYLQELWFKQVIGNFELTAGLQDLNVEFATSEYGSLYLNSSFGILPIISGNVCAPIFPLTTLGFTVKWNITNKVTWLAAVYDGCPTPFKENPYNLKWNYQRNDGIISISEFQYNTNIDDLQGTYKLGVFSYTNNLFNRTQLHDKYKSDVFGLYLHADQQIWRNDYRSLSAFSQFGFSPSQISEHGVYIGAGLNLTGAFSKKAVDNLGIAVGCINPQARINLSSDKKLLNYSKCETSIELTYSYAISEHIFLQPDIQYIVNPSGTDQTLENSFVGILRIGLTF